MLRILGLLLLMTTSVHSRAGEFDQRTLLPGTNPAFDAKTILPGPIESIGTQSRGCIAGAKALDQNHSDYIVMNPHRNAYYGNPELVKNVEKWARTYKNLSQESGRCQKMLIADMGYPRGGPITPRHASHQAGNDVDILWSTTSCENNYENLNDPKSAPDFVLYDIQRKELQGAIVYQLHAPVDSELLKNAVKMVDIVAHDEDVQLVLVNPVARRALCEQADIATRAQNARMEKWKKLQEQGQEIALDDIRLETHEIPEDLKYLRRVRFVPGHTYHFHVRAHQCLGQGPCEKPLRRPYADPKGKEWGLSCLPNSGIMQWYFKDTELTFQPNAEFTEPKSQLESEMQKRECERSPLTYFCRQRQAHFEAEQKAKDSAMAENRTRAQNSKAENPKEAPVCYDIVVQTEGEEDFTVQKCVPQKCDHIFHKVHHFQKNSH